MVRGLYTAYTGMRNQQHRLDTITNNLANSSTTGYKREGVTAQAFDDMLMTKLKDGSEGYVDRNVGTMSLGVKIGENYTDYTQGSFKATENTFDLAIGGNGFVTLSYTNKQGVESTTYTRDGSFTLNKEGYLVTKDGDFVQGENGNIKLSREADIVFDDDGTIYENGQYADKLLIADFEDYSKFPFYSAPYKVILDLNGHKVGVSYMYISTGSTVVVVDTTPSVADAKHIMTSTILFLWLFAYIL